MQIRRGDIVIVELNPTKGSEQQGTARPCVVMQNDIGNKNAPTTIIDPFTTQYTPTNTYPFEGEVLASTTALTQDSVADLSQIRGVDIDTRIQKQIGAVPSARMKQSDQAMKTSLGL